MLKAKPLEAKAPEPVPELVEGVEGPIVYQQKFKVVDSAEELQKIILS